MMFDKILNLFSKKPKASFEIVESKIAVKSYNKAFIDDLRKRFGEAALGKTDQQVIQLYLDRENLEREEPRLEVIHAGLEQDGRVKMTLDWNRAFINHLRENGITGESEDEAVQKYLSMLTSEVQAESAAAAVHDSILSEFDELDQQTAQELAEAEELVKKQERKLRREQNKAKAKAKQPKA